MFNDILVALKFSPASLFALDKGVQLARVHGARLHVFHALDYRLQSLDEDHPDLLACFKEADRRFEAELQPLLGGYMDVSLNYSPADPAMEICKIAKAAKADLIVLGCHQPLKTISMGRVDYVGMTILEKAPCPVLLVPYSD